MQSVWLQGRLQMHGDFLGSHKLHDSEAVTLLVLNLPSKTVS